MILKKAWHYHIALFAILIIMRFFTAVYLGSGGEFLENYAELYDFTFYFTWIAIYFVNFKFVCPQFLNKRRLPLFFILLGAQILLFAGIRFLLEEVILYEITGVHNYHERMRTFVRYVSDNSYFTTKPLLFSTILFVGLRYTEKQQQVFQLQLEKNKADLSFLKSQINPHFLFNTLNSFYVELIDDKPDTANDIQKLSSLLRHVIDQSQEDSLFLKDEIEFLEDYIHFYRKRFEDRLFLNFEIRGEVKLQKVPSLVFIHFIENVLKHGNVANSETPASIVITVAEETIQIETSNLIDPSEKYEALGISTQNLKRRLTAIFDDNYEMHTQDENDYFKAFLKIPL